MEMFRGVDADTGQEFILVVAGDDRHIITRYDAGGTWSPPIRLRPEAVAA